MLKVSLISTVYNEISNIEEYLSSITGMTKLPDELIIVDGGSTDGTYEYLNYFASNNPPFPVKLRLEKGCNIAKGRNIAIDIAAFEIIAASDAGCRLAPCWLEEITKPFYSTEVDVVGGWYEPDARSFFENAVADCTFTKLSKVDRINFLPSSRSIAFRKSAWKRVGGYPEWLTLTAEDSLFDINLKKAGCIFDFSEKAIVRWRPRKDLKSLLRQYYLYGIGDGEARLFSFYHKKKIIKLTLLIITIQFLLLRHLEVSFILTLFTILAYCKSLYQIRIKYFIVSMVLTIFVDVAHLTGLFYGRSGIIHKHNKRDNKE